MDGVDKRGLESAKSAFLFLLCGLLAGCGGGPQRVKIYMDDMDDFDVHKPLAVREIAEIVIAPQGPGRYTFYCGTPGHQMVGMEGALIVDP